ncbi:MAG: hypothetical protein VKJ02_17635 [Snowella sp.]|nr:hypothetical protein [Snowella sp.]
MIIPSIGLLILVLSLWVIFDQKILSPYPLIQKLKKDRVLLIGIIIIALALMLGYLGYWGLIDSRTLRISRQTIIIWTIVALILNSPVLGQLLRISQFTQQEQSSPWRWFTINTVLMGVSTYILGCLLIRCFIQIDGNGDTWMYQLPFAARMWNLVTAENYLMDADRELLYETFPKLANFLQGMFWSMAGLRNPQVANLVSFLSLLGFLGFVKTAFKIPFYLIAIALLAVPLIHIAATACYVDLFGNVGASMVILCTYLFYIDQKNITRQNILFFILGGAIASNTKFLMVPIVALFFGLALARILYLQITWNPLKVNRQNLYKIAILAPLSSIVIFFTEFLNILTYQNPFYPLKISLFGFVLNHASVPSSDYMSAKIQAMSPIQRWVYSLLEIGAFDARRPWPWSIAMDFVPLDSDSFGIGGYFAIYVVFNLLVFAFLCRHLNNITKISLGLMIGLSVITAFMPFSYQLRYYSYWIIVLIVLNLYLIKLEAENSNRNRNYYQIKLQHYGLVSVSILFIFLSLTRWDFTYPRSNFLDGYLAQNVDVKTLSELKDNQDYCLVNFSPHTFLYNSRFYPQRNYSIKNEFDISPEYLQENCKERIMLFPRPSRS